MTADRRPQPVSRRLPSGGRLLTAIVPALLLLAFALRVHRIGEQRVWWDEGWSVWVARFSSLDILRQTGNDVHPPLYFELLHLWRALSGDEEAALRLLSAFFGVLTVALTYALGRRMARGTLSSGFATLAGLLAALFLAVSRFAIAWSQEIRMYALAMLLGLLLTSPGCGNCAWRPTGDASSRAGPGCNFSSWRCFCPGRSTLRAAFSARPRPRPSLWAIFSTSTGRC
ncbi:MAG: hypothetical protein DCC51_08865 [Anaerolineae bacterium]|nr:MAG: hypothetical protein DCC51_08865 [Anaerolineae bacterium]